MPSHYDGSFGYAGLAPSDEEDAIFFTMIYRFRVGRVCYKRALQLNFNGRLVKLNS